MQHSVFESTLGREASVMSLAGRKRRQSLALISEINVAAFAGIMVVLLALFAIPAMWVLFTPETGRAADWPHVPHARPMRGANRTDAIWVTVQRTGDVFLGNERLAPYKLPEGIEQRLKRGSERKIYISADARAKYGRVREVVAAIQSSGVEKVAFLVWEGKTYPVHSLVRNDSR
jgi:biopolymer transport protein ExbD